MVAEALFMAHPPDRPRSRAADAPSDADLDAWIARHQASVWRYLRFLGADPELARDLTQDAFVACIRAGAVQRADRPAGALLRQAARHRFVSHLRQLDRRPAATELDEGEAAWQWFAGAAGDASDRAIDHLRACVAALPDQHRRAIERTYEDGFGRAQLGRELGIGAEGVKALLRRARSRLRACIERKMAGGETPGGER